MIEKELEIKNKNGLHVRTAALFITVINKYKVNIFIEKDLKKINTKSIVNILSLGIKQGDKIKITVEGKKEEQSIKALEKLIEEIAKEEEKEK